MRKRRFSVWPLIAGAALCGLGSGCPGPDRNSGGGPSGAGAGGAPLRGVELRLLVVHLPAGDEAIDHLAWQVTDEGVLSPKLRVHLGNNAMRAALAGTDPPAVIARWMQDRGASRVRSWHGALAFGSARRLNLTEQRRTRTFLISDPVRGVYGEEFSQAVCQLAVTVRAGTEGTLRLSVTPIVEHGRLRPRRVTDAVSGTMVTRVTRQEQPFASLAMTVAVQPGQILMIGTRGDASRSSLGGHLFIEESQNGLEQKVVLIRATTVGTSGRVEPPTGG